MAIKLKGVNDISITKQQVITVVITWLMFSYILYAFLYMFREAFRVMTALGAVSGYQPLLVLTDTELFIYNLFYASIASAIGYMFAMRLVLQSINKHQARKTRYFIRNTLNDQGFITWSFLLWFGKVGAMLGITFGMVPLQYDINFASDFPLFLISLPIVLFLGTWTSLRRVIRTKAFTWLGLSSIIFISMSFVLSQRNFTDVDKVNHGLLNNNIDYVYSLNLPRSQSHEVVMKRSLISEVFVVLDSLNSPRIFFNDINGSVVLSDLDVRIKHEKDKLSIYEQDRWMPVLLIDSDIPMSFIKDLEYRFRKSEVTRVMYSTGMKYSKYPSNYPLLRLSGIKRYLGPKYYPEFESFLDSAELLDRSKYSVRLPKSLMYRVNALDEYNRIEISLGKSAIEINGQSVNEKKLEEVVYGFFKRYSPDAVAIYNVHGDVDYGRYIEILDVLYWQIDRLRNELSWEMYDEPFEQWDMGEKKNTLMSKYPRAVVEWTREEKRLIKLVR